MERRPVVGYEGLYEVSDDGQVFSMTRRLKGSLRFTYRDDGSVVVELTKDGACRTCRIHRLVAAAFIDNPLSYNVVNHIDGDKTNNSVSNLEWRDATMDIAKYSASKRASNPSKKRRRISVCAKNTATGMKTIYKSIKSTERLGFNIMAVENCCKGRIKSHAGFEWSYVE